MKEGTRYRHKVTGSVAEVVHNFSDTLGMVAMVNGCPFTITKIDLIRDWVRLDPPH